MDGTSGVMGQCSTRFILRAALGVKGDARIEFRPSPWRAVAGPVGVLGILDRRDPRRDIRGSGSAAAGLRPAARFAATNAQPGESAPFQACFRLTDHSANAAEMPAVHVHFSGFAASPILDGAGRQLRPTSCRPPSRIGDVSLSWSSAHPTNPTRKRGFFVLHPWLGRRVSGKKSFRRRPP